MGRKVSKISRGLVLVFMLALAVTFGGCTGDTGPQGPPGPPGQDATASPLTTAAPESCATCHIDAGSSQSVYSTARTQGTNATSPLLGTIDNVTVTDSGTTDTNGNELYDVNATFTFNDPTVDPTTLDQKRAMWAVYDPETDTFPDAGSLTLTATDTGFTISGQVTYFFNDGTNAGTADGDIYCYFAKTPIKGASDGGHVQMYNEVSNIGYKFGTWTYTSPVDVANCEKCHGTPYLKHGYRGAVATNLDPFVPCKNCHYDTRAGSDGDVFFGDATYAYTANVETDVHASHNNEFPYPQSMADCVNCHTYDAATAPNDKFDMTLSDANFTYANCTTCHADVAADNTVVPKPISTIVPANHPTVSATLDCTLCHGNGAPTFQQIHPGYDTIKYASLADAVAGTLRYTYSIDNITYDGTASTLTITWSIKDASGNAVTAPLNADPTNGPAFLGLPEDRNNESEGIRILVGYYGWGSNNVADYDNIRKDDIITDSTVDATTGEVTTVFPLSDKLTTYQATKLDVGIIGVPEVQDGATAHMVAVKSVTKNITLADGTLDVRNSPVDNANCNTCHDNIVMHTGDTHGHTTVGNENACVFCHNTSSAAHHYDQQSRSIDSYVHAVHVFPTEEFIFPTFTTEDCEACHKTGTYDVPDQTKWIGSVIGGPEGDVTVGPGSRACGSCHRAQFIKESDTNSLDSLNQHTKQFGYRVPTADAPYTDVINKIEGMLGQ
jgi:hypothetical protein